MRLRPRAGLCAAIAVAGVLAVTGLATEAPKQVKEKQDIWQDEPADSRPSWYRRGLSEDTINRVMQALGKRDPAKARELQKLRKSDPERFKSELREQAQPELDQIARDYWEVRRQRRNTEFLEWVKANYPAEEQTLAGLKHRDPLLYAKSFDHLMNVYGYIFEAERSNPELGAVLKEDFDLKKRSDELCRQIRRERADARKQSLGLELQEVVARRYDLIVRRKEIAYEELIKRLEDLQRQAKEGKDEIVRWQDESIKRENVRQRLQALTDNKVKFKWD